MNKGEESDLKSRILQEMVVDHSGTLERNLDLAKRFISITTAGKVEIVCKAKLIDKEKILLYLVGKQYAKTAELAEREHVGNKELANELGIPHDTIRRRLKDLRDEKKISQLKEGKHVFHCIPENLVQRTLKAIEEKHVKKSVEKRGSNDA